MKPHPKQNAQSVLITGCSSGFGRAAVTLFLEKGWRVIATLRDADKRSELFEKDKLKYKDSLDILNFDVSSSTDLKKTVEWVRERFDGRLNCLINNAGYGLFGALEDYTEDQLRHQFEVNFFGVARLTQALLPFIRQTQGTIINLSSVLGYLGMPITSAYSASKHALEGLTEALYYELKPFGVKVSIVEPGRFGTSFNDKSSWANSAFDPHSPYFHATQSYLGMKAGAKKKVPPPRPDKVAKILLKLALMKRPPLRVRCGKEAHMIFALKHTLPDFLVRKILSHIFG